MKTIKKLMLFIGLLLFAMYSQAQFTSSGSAASKKGSGQSNSGSDRQQDIYLLEQKAKTMEQDFMSQNTEVFDKHKSDVLSIMDREIVRSTNDLAQLKYKLKKLPDGPQSQEGRALQIEINQMDGRLGREKFIRSNVAALKKEDLNIDNTRELAGLRGQYGQFIDNMKKNLKSSGGTASSGNQGGNSGTSHSTSSGTASNAMYNSSSSSAGKKKEELPESYYRMKDRKSGENYLRTKKNTALALSTAAKEIEATMNKGKKAETAKLQQDILERMASDIATDKKITNQLDNGALKFSGLNAGMIKNETTKKEALLNKGRNIKLPQQKGYLFSLINQYIQLLK